MKANLNQALMTAARWILEGPQSARRFRNSFGLKPESEKGQ